MEDINMDDVYNLTKSAVARSKQWVYREFDDTLQEALIYVVSNLKYYKKEKGRLATFIFANVKRSLMNQVRYVNAKKRQFENNFYSLDMPVNEEFTLNDQIEEECTVEHEAIWEDLLTRLTPLERDIATVIVTEGQWKPLLIKYKVDHRKMMSLKNNLLEKLKGEFFMNC